MQRQLLALRREIKRRIPARLRRKLRQLTTPRNLTIAEGWERLARSYDGDPNSLGNAWHEPETVGVAVPSSEFVSYLDKAVFEGFLGSCETVLEIGPGGGRFTEILLPKCQRLIAADTSSTMLKILKNRFKYTSRSIEYVHLDGNGLAFLEENSVDGVFSYDVFVHLPHWDFYNYLVEIRRVLKPQGKAIIHHANTFSSLGWDKFLSDVPQCIGRHRTTSSFTVMDGHFMGMLCERAGLRMVDWRSDVVPRDAIALLECTPDTPEAR